MLGAGIRLAVTSKKWSVAVSLIMLLGICAALRVWTWPSLALVLPGASVTFLLAIYPRTRRWIAAVSLLLAAWWLGVAAYSFYEQETVRGALNIVLLFATLSLPDRFACEVAWNPQWRLAAE